MVNQQLLNRQSQEIENKGAYVQFVHLNIPPTVMCNCASHIREGIIR
jgi:hypothetical protein